MNDVRFRFNPLQIILFQVIIDTIDVIIYILYIYQIICFINRM